MFTHNWIPYLNLFDIGGEMWPSHVLDWFTFLHLISLIFRETNSWWCLCSFGLKNSVPQKKYHSKIFLIFIKSKTNRLTISVPCFRLPRLLAFPQAGISGVPNRQLAPRCGSCADGCDTSAALVWIMCPDLEFNSQFISRLIEALKAFICSPCSDDLTRSSQLLKRALEGGSKGRQPDIKWTHLRHDLQRLRFIMINMEHLILPREKHVHNSY